MLSISKEALLASIVGRVWYNVSFIACLAGLSALLHKAKCILFYSRVLRGVRGGLMLALVTSGIQSKVSSSISFLFRSNASSMGLSA